MITLCIPKLLWKQFYFFSLQYIRISGKSIKFDNKKIRKIDFYKNKKVNSIDDFDFNKTLVSIKEPYGTNNSFRYFTGYNDNDVIRPSNVSLPQMADYIRKFDENATMPFRANNKQLLNNYNKIWEKSEKLMKIDFESKPFYGDNDKYIKTKIRIYAGSIITNFHNKKMLKEKYHVSVYQ